MDERKLPRNPYKGLHAFEYGDAVDFFGRENLIREMILHVEDILRDERGRYQVPRCMMVVGASGSGKSSVVMAGLLPALENEENIPEVKRWFFLEPVRPGEDPMNALAHALKLPFLNKKDVSPFKGLDRLDLLKILEEPDFHGLNELLRKITASSDARVVLVVDQFEEIFAPTVDSKQREQFINLLMATATEPDTPLLLLFTLRADFYGFILNNKALYKKVERHLINIPPMTREELREVIEKPVQPPDVNVTFDPYLAEDLLREVFDRPESLPLLQFTLEQLFDRDSEGRRLTRQSYDEIGGLQGAIDKHAEATYARLRTSERRMEARKLFTEHFIYISESYDEPSRLESGGEIIRRRVSQADLHLDALHIRSDIISAFVNARLLTATSRVRQSAGLKNIPDITYEISHEALINAWGRLREWIKEDLKDIYMVQSLRPRIRQWGQERNQKNKEELLVEKSALQQLQKYRQRKRLGPLAEEFFMASLARQRRQKIRISFFFVGIAVLVILSLVLGLTLRDVLFPNPTIVTSVADSGSGTLTDALQKASDGTTITFDKNLTGQTIYLAHGDLDINKSITIRGPTGSINIRTGNAGQHIYIGQGHSVTLENLTFTDSYTLKHSIIENDGNLTINNSTIDGDESYNRGGAIYNTGDLILNSDTIINNRVSTDGGAIYNLFGTVSINNSTIRGNTAKGNGGGIYSQGGTITLDKSHILYNSAENNIGGGIAMLNGSLDMHNTHIESNQSSADGSRGFGGGIAVVGSVAFITTSVITNNTASAKGGGIVVAKNTDNDFTSLVKLQDIANTKDSNARYYIGGNRGGDIAGESTSTGTTLQISDDPSIDNFGSPPPPNPPQKLPNYLGVADINAFCLSKGDSYGKVSINKDSNATDIMFTCFNRSDKAVGSDFSGQEICQSQYLTTPRNTVIDRMANYFDPTSLQCYKNLEHLGPIGQDDFDQYCKIQSYMGLFDNAKYRETAYDWLCQPNDKLPTGLSVTGACNMKYSNNAIDRLANFNSINGWECWKPKPV